MLRITSENAAELAAPHMQTRVLITWSAFFKKSPGEPFAQ